MIKNNTNPNIILNPGFGCSHCGKKYKTRTNLNKHQLLCETLVRAKNSRYINKKLISGESDIPTPEQMYEIILDLSNKCEHLEKTVYEMQKWVDKTKKKINIVDWLTSQDQQQPFISWDKFIESIEILKEETEMILHYPFLHVFQEIVNRVFIKEFVPLFAFTEKPNHMYLYFETWREASKEDILKALNQIHFKFVKAFIEWKKKNETKINESDGLCELCNKANIKIMGTQFKDSSTYHKYRLCIYNKIKTDMKTVIEYEFET